MALHSCEFVSSPNLFVYPPELRFACICIFRSCTHILLCGGFAGAARELSVMKSVLTERPTTGGKDRY